MNKINSLAELQPGQEVNIFSHQFEVENPARFICGDYTGMQRDIGYFQFSDRGFKPIDKMQLVDQIRKDDVDNTVFALWGTDLSHNTITIK